MNTIRAVLDSGWTVTGATLAWLAFVAGLLLRVATRSREPAPRHTQLWDGQPAGGADE
jgi:hypothetical protein